MDLTKIGKYIAGKRKELGLTQREVAEKLGMSDKSVSKWERGICLPDVSIYSDLCMILGITINEFLAGEDIPKESVIQKSEENIIGVATDSKHKQIRLKHIIMLLLAISIIMIGVLGIMVFRSMQPQNYIAPVAKDSPEMKAIEMISGMPGAFMCRYSATSDFDNIQVYISEYHSGELADRRNGEITFTEVGSPKEGTILIVPDIETFCVKVIIADSDFEMTTHFPVMEGIENRYYYGRSTVRLEEKTDIRYNEEQPLVALIFDQDEMWVPGMGIASLMDEATLAHNDYVYLFSVAFVKTT